MFPRALEAALACWLAASPWIFDHPADASGQWATDLACAAVVFVLAVLSFAHPLRRMHLLELLPAGWLAVWGYALAGGGAAAQNDLIVALLIAMLAIMPSYGTEPPEAWLRWYREHREG